MSFASLLATDRCVVKGPSHILSQALAQKFDPAFCEVAGVVVLGFRFLADIFIIKK